MPESVERPDFFTRPVLSVSDMGASLDYYRDKLGFSVLWTNPQDDALCIAGLERAGIDLILQHDSGVPSSTRPSVVAAELHAHVKLDHLHDELSRRGAIIRRAPFQVPWQANVHQLEVEDPDGNLLLFWGDLP
jgi:catechol 2,3-dioxygenase-like lactoylglutathione lyase family enzyme